MSNKLVDVTAISITHDSSEPGAIKLTYKLNEDTPYGILTKSNYVTAMTMGYEMIDDKVVHHLGNALARKLLLKNMVVNKLNTRDIRDETMDYQLKKIADGIVDYYESIFDNSGNHKI